MLIRMAAKDTIFTRTRRQTTRRRLIQSNRPSELLRRTSLCCWVCVALLLGSLLRPTLARLENRQRSAALITETHTRPLLARWVILARGTDRWRVVFIHRLGGGLLTTTLCEIGVLFWFTIFPPLTRWLDDGDVFGYSIRSMLAD